MSWQKEESEGEGNGRWCKAVCGRVCVWDISPLVDFDSCIFFFDQGATERTVGCLGTSDRVCDFVSVVSVFWLLGWEAGGSLAKRGEGVPTLLVSMSFLSDVLFFLPQSFLKATTKGMMMCTPPTELFFLIFAVKKFSLLVCVCVKEPSPMSRSVWLGFCSCGGLALWGPSIMRDRTLSHSRTCAVGFF